MKYSEFKPQLNEAKEYLVPERKAWLHADGTLATLKLGGEHSGWYKRKYKDHKDYTYPNEMRPAFTDGWIRVVNTYEGSLSLQGDEEALRKTFRLWWPTAATSDMVYIETVLMPPKYGYGQNYSYSMIKPREKSKLRRDFGLTQS